MKFQRYIRGLIVILIVTLLCGCGERTDDRQSISFKDTVEAQKEGSTNAVQNASSAIGDMQSTDNQAIRDNKHYVGDIVTYQVGDSGKIEVMLTDWGSVYDELEGILLYVDYRIENIGTERVAVGGEMFEVYADDYRVEQDYLQDNIILMTDLSGGRKVSGTFYAYVNPNNVGIIEVECYDSVFVLKDENRNSLETEAGAMYSNENQDTDSVAFGGMDIWQASFRWETGENEDARGAELVLWMDAANDNASIEGSSWAGINVGEFSGLAMEVYDDGTIEFMDENGNTLFVSPLDDGGIYVEESGNTGGMGTTFAGTYQRIP